MMYTFLVPTCGAMETCRIRFRMSSTLLLLAASSSKMFRLWPFVEGLARFALATGHQILAQVLAVDRPCKDARTGGLTHPAWTGEEEGLGQMLAP